MKPRLCNMTGKPLPDNIYNDPKRRVGVYRYRRPDGTFKVVRGSYEEVFRKAATTNAARRESPARSGTIRFWVDRYIIWYERQNNGADNKDSWKNRRRLLRKFSDEFNTLQLKEVSVLRLTKWWDDLTYDQQHNRRAAFSYFFQWAMGRSAALQNPFNCDENSVHLMEKKKPSKQRLPLHLPEFWEVHKHAESFVQRAMIISLTTTMREGDIASLRFDAVRDDYLHVTVGKSAAQRGSQGASHLKWELSKHEFLRTAINECREVSLKFQRCPYVIARSRKQKKHRNGFPHPFQVTPNDISKGFTKAVRASGLWNDIKQGRKPPTFHEVRGLAIQLFLTVGVNPIDVAQLAAHTDVAVTRGYAANHSPEYRDAGLVMTPEMITSIS